MPRPIDRDPSSAGSSARLPSSDSMRRIGAHAIPLVLLAYGLLFIVLPQSDFFRAIPGDLGDARFNRVILEHLHRWVSGLDASLWSPPFFFPFPGVLAFSENYFGTAAIYSLLRAVGASPEIAYIGWVTIAYPLNFLCCSYVLRRFGLGAAGAAVGAFVFTFAMPVLAQYSHAQLGYRFATPLALLALHELVRTGRPAHLAWLCVWVTMQFYASIYLGYFLLLLLGAYAVAPYLARTTPDRLHRAVLALRSRPGLLRSGLVVLLCAAALFALLYPYLHYSHLYGFVRDPGELRSMLPRIGSYFLADKSVLWGSVSQWVSGIPMRHEQQMFFGLAVWALAVLGLASRAARTSAWAFLLLVLLTLEVAGHSLYTLIASLPMANAIRAVSRICMFMLFPLAFLAGTGFDRLLGWAAAGRRAGAVMAVLLGALMLLETTAFRSSKVALTQWQARHDALLSQVPPDLGADAILFVPRHPQEPTYLTELDGMVVAQHLGRPTINGYSGNVPLGWSIAMEPCEDWVDRVAAYARFAHLDDQQFGALARSVVPIGAHLSCVVPSHLPQRTTFQGPLPEAAFAAMQIRILDLRLDRGGKLILDTQLSNRGATVLPSVSNSRQPIRFSWRFVADGAAPALADFAPRFDLPLDVPAHGKLDQPLQVNAPKKPGRYRIEVTLVQEGVAWFHLKGMPLGEGAPRIIVALDGRVSLEY